MDTISKIVIFLAGAGIGSAITFKLVKDKYEKLANDEISEMREYYKEKMNPKSKSEYENETIDYSDDTKEEPSNDKKDYNKIIKDNKYDNEYDNEEGKEDVKKVEGPYVISPDDFDSIGYETESLTYYSDGVLTDIYDNIISDVEGKIGEDSLNHFGEYEDDSVFVRNDEEEMDYEILKDDDKYYDKYPEERG